MSGDILIGIDAGTSVIKAVAFDLDGQQIAMANRRNSYDSLPGGGVEQNMQRTWDDTAAVLRELSAQIDPARVQALGVTGQGDGTWLIDADGNPVHDGWLWLDARAAQEARDIEASEGIETIYKRTGTGINVCQMRTHLLWLKRHAPDLLSRAATAFHCKDWLYLKLTGVRATDPTEGVFTFGDFRTRSYSDDVLQALGLSAQKHLLPDIVDGAAETHALSAEAARATGLPQGLPVSLGYVDIMCTALGAGLYDATTRPGFTIIGSTGVHMRFVADSSGVHLNTDRSGYTMPFPGTAYAQIQTNMAATLNIDWILGLGVQLLAAQGVEKTPGDLLQDLDERLMETQPGLAIYHPYVSHAGERGPFANPLARASFTGLSQSTGWFDLVRGVYDGLVLAARDCYGAMGPLPDEIRLSGGGARSKALRHALAAGLNRPVRSVAQDEAGAAGAVMMAGIATGHFADAEAASEAWVRPLLQDPEAPDAALTGAYDAMFAGYKATREAMPPVWDAHAAMRESLS